MSYKSSTIYCKILNESEVHRVKREGRMKEIAPDILYHLILPGICWFLIWQGKKPRNLVKGHWTSQIARRWLNGTLRLIGLGTEN